jgi:tetratricopeptide (TPR) repeat protein
MKKHLLGLAAALALAGFASAQTGAIEGDVKGPDGKGLKDALVRIERTDIKGNYKVKTDKKGHYFHAGLPLGQYIVHLDVDGKEVDSVKGVRTRLGDPVPVNFDLAGRAQQQAAMQKAAETGEVTQEVTRDMTPEQKAALEKAMKERSAAMQKNKALNDAFNGGMEAMKAQQWETGIAQFSKAAEMDPKQHVIWAQLADCYSNAAKAKTGAERDGLAAKGLEAYSKAIELKPDDASYINNYALALARAGKFTEAQTELEKAATLDPTNAGRYFYNLGALLTNAGQLEPAGTAFKKAVDADPNYADAQYQYAMYLVAKASLDPKTGAMTFPPGTREGLEKYVQLKPDGPFAESAKSLITTMGGKIETTYTNPDAKKKAPAAKKK